MSLYADYIFEREGKEVLETDRGFATFERHSDGIYIVDIFVAEQFRKTGEASRLADRIASIALDRGFTKLYGSVVPSTKNSTSSLKVLLAYGFKLNSCTNNFILLEKELA